MNNQIPPKTTSTSKGLLIVVGVILICVIGSCVLVGILGSLGNKNQTNATVENQTNTNSTPIINQPVKTVANKSNIVPSPSEKVSEIKWDEYDRVYSIHSNSTDLQKESLWSNFKGKYVVWSGEVVEVSDGAISGLSLSIKMNKETLTHDLIVYLKDDQKNTAMSLTKGKKIKFAGKLKSYTGAFLPGTIEEGEILQ